MYTCSLIFFVRALKFLQNSIIFIRYCPKAWLSAGDGFALFANKINLIVASGFRMFVFELPLGSSIAGMFEIGIEPMTQGFSILCSNQLSYPNGPGSDVLLSLPSLPGSDIGTDSATLCFVRFL